jgi:NAD-dependent deacetylase
MYDHLAKVVATSGAIVFFGGAGVSTESGIPDFRSEQGLYAAKARYGRSPEELLSHSFFAREPAAFFSYYRDNLVHQSAKPNAAHLALAKLEQAGKLRAIITQNIDGLHQAAGSKAVYELHGSIHRNYCLDCKAVYPLEYVLSAGDPIPFCAKCGGMVRPDVVLYEEALDENTWSNAIEAIQSADALIVGGTSLSVYPAASLLRYYDGDRLCLINKTKTPYDDGANLVIHDSIGSVLSAII